VRRLLGDRPGQARKIAIDGGERLTIPTPRIESGRSDERDDERDTDGDDPASEARALRRRDNGSGAFRE
jgi:hypothetical protein